MDVYGYVCMYVPKQEIETSANLFDIQFQFCDIVWHIQFRCC